LRQFIGNVYFYQYPIVLVFAYWAYQSAERIIIIVLWADIFNSRKK